MKCTLNIDDSLLERVILLTGAPTKTEAIHVALREIDRRARLLEVLHQGSGVAESEVRTLFAPASGEGLRVAESPTPYLTKGPRS